MKHPRAFLAAVLALALLSAGCATIQEPEGWAAPVAVEGDLLVQTAKGELSRVDPTSGSVLWTYPTNEDDRSPFYATPIVDGDSVFVVSYEGRVARLNVATGQPNEEWVLQLNANVVASPVLHNDTLYVPTQTGRIEVVTAGDGLVLNTVRTADRRIWGAPAASNGTLYVGDLDNGATVAIDTEAGETRWEQEISGPTAADLVLDGDLLIVGAFDQHVHALDVTREGEERWAFAGDGWFMARPLVDGDVIYAATMDGAVYALRRETGAELWSFAPEGKTEFRAAPRIIGDALIVAARDGRVFALDAASGEMRWMQDVGAEGNVNADPYVDGGELFLLTSKHHLIRVDVAQDGAFQNVPLAAGR